MTPKDPDRRRLIVASATLAALGGNTLASTALPDDHSDKPDTVPPEGVITPEVIAHAEKLAGISFTPEERETMAKTIVEQIELFARRIKAGAMPNELAPAMIFRALPAGEKIRPATPRGNPQQLGGEPGPLPATDRDIAFSPVTSLARWLRTTELTSERLTRIYLRRIEQLNPKLECVITVTRELALEQARRADRELAEGIDRGPLHGIPYAAKDIIDTATIRTT